MLVFALYVDALLCCSYLRNYKLQCAISKFKEIFASALRSRLLRYIAIGVKDIRDVNIYQNSIYLRYSCVINSVFNVNNAIAIVDGGILFTM